MSDKLQKLAESYVAEEYKIEAGYVSIRPWFGRNDFDLDSKTIEKIVASPNGDKIQESVDNIIFNWQDNSWELISEAVKPILKKIRLENDCLTLAEYDEVTDLVYGMFEVDMSEAYQGILDNNHVDLTLNLYHINAEIDYDDNGNLEGLADNADYQGALSIVGQDNESVLIEAVESYGYQCINCLSFGLSVTVGEYLEIVRAGEAGKEITFKPGTSLMINDNPDDHSEKIVLVKSVTVSAKELEFITASKGNFYYYHKGDFVVTE